MLQDVKNITLAGKHGRDIFISKSIYCLLFNNRVITAITNRPTEANAETASYVTIVSPPPMRSSRPPYIGNSMIKYNTKLEQEQAFFGCEGLFMLFKLPYILISLVVGQACLGALPEILLCYEFASGILAATAVFYIASFMLKKTKLFHEIIGWAWCILPIQLFWHWIGYAAEWGGGSTVLMLTFACTGVILEWMWVHDPVTKMESHGLTGLISIWIIGGAATDCIMYFFPLLVNRLTNYFI